MSDWFQVCQAASGVAWISEKKSPRQTSAVNRTAARGSQVRDFGRRNARIFLRQDQGSSSMPQGARASKAKAPSPSLKGIYDYEHEHEKAGGNFPESL